MTEIQFQRQITDLLTVERVLHFRNNVAAMKLSYKGKSRFVRFGTKGMADLIAFVPSSTNYRHQNIWWIELKVGIGKQSEAQRGFQVNVEGFGHYYSVIRDAEQVTKFLYFLRSQ